LNGELKYRTKTQSTPNCSTIGTAKTKDDGVFGNFGCTVFARRWQRRIFEKENEMEEKKLHRISKCIEMAFLSSQQQQQ
jgi:hypothetical protein